MQVKYRYDSGKRRDCTMFKKPYGCIRDDIIFRPMWQDNLKFKVQIHVCTAFLFSTKVKKLMTEQTEGSTVPRVLGEIFPPLSSLQKRKKPLTFFLFHFIFTFYLHKVIFVTSLNNKYHLFIDRLHTNNHNNNHHYS